MQSDAGFYREQTRFRAIGPYFWDARLQRGGMYNKIMVPLDGSEFAECVLPHVEGIVQGCHVRTIVFIRAIKPVSPFTIGMHQIGGDDFQKLEGKVTRFEEEQIAEAKNYLSLVAKRFSEHTKLTILKEVIVANIAGSLAECLIYYAEKNKIDLILIATHGRSGLIRCLLGSVADKIIHASHIPVLMVRAFTT